MKTLLIITLWLGLGVGPVFAGIKVKPKWSMTGASAILLIVIGPIGLITVGLAGLLEFDKCLANCGDKK